MNQQSRPPPEDDTGSDEANEFLSLFHGDLNLDDLAPISQQFVESYSQLAQLGLPASAVAAAMLRATVNFYDVFGMSEQLPRLLRLMAEAIELPGEPS